LKKVTVCPKPSRCICTKLCCFHCTAYLAFSVGGGGIFFKNTLKKKVLCDIIYLFYLEFSFNVLMPASIKAESNRDKGVHNATVVQIFG
jgi:hypothetical protein